MALYLDLAILLNFAVDFLLLLGADRLSGFPLRPGRALGAAALGALYSGVCLLGPFRFLGNLLWRLVTLGAMGCLCYGLSPSGFRRTLVFFILSLALGGMAMGFQKGSFPLLILEAGLLYALCRWAFGSGIGEKTYIPITLTRQGRTLSLNALVDTGNGLRDPLTGEPVLVIGPEAAETLTGLTRAQLEHPTDTLLSSSVPGLRLVPCTTVLGSTMLLALRFPEARIRNAPASPLVAFAPEGLGQGRMYEALTGGNL